MASVESITNRCLLCGKELPRGGFSAQVSGVYLFPVCADCQDRCSSDPNGVVAEHPQLFEGTEIVNPHIHPTSSGTQFRPPIQSERPRIETKPASYSHASSSGPQQVIVTDFHMPFGSMVGFMVKWAIASIPAFIILFVLGFILVGILAAMTGVGTGLLR